MVASTGSGIEKAAKSRALWAFKPVLRLALTGKDFSPAQILFEISRLGWGGDADMSLDSVPALFRGVAIELVRGGHQNLKQWWDDVNDRGERVRKGPRGSIYASPRCSCRSMRQGLERLNASRKRYGAMKSRNSER